MPNSLRVLSFTANGNAMHRAKSQLEKRFLGEQHLSSHLKFFHLHSPSSAVRPSAELYAMENSGRFDMVIRPRKKARTAIPGLLQTERKDKKPAPSSGRRICALFFDTIPEECLDNVLKCFSLLPDAENWWNHLPLSNIVELYRVNAELGNFLKNRFDTLCISKRADCDVEGKVYEWKVPTGNMLWTNSIHIAHDFVLRAGSGPVRAIINGDKMYDEHRDGIGMVGDFRGACPNVRSLSVVENNALWATAFARLLDKLEVVSNKPIAAIPKGCPSSLVFNHHNKKDTVSYFDELLAFYADTLL